MKPKDLIMYIVDDNVLLYKEKLIKEKPKRNIIYNGKISKPQEFSKFLEEVLKKYKLNKNLINNSITVLVDPTYTQADTEVIDKILEKLSFTKINFINIISLLNVTKKQIWLIANKRYMYLVHLNYKNKIETIFIDYKLFKNNIKLLINHLSFFIKGRRVILLGFYDNIEELAEQIEGQNNSYVYYINDTFNYYINKKKNTLDK